MYPSPTECRGAWPTQQRGWRALLGVLAALAASLAPGCASAALDFTRVGPRPAPGRTVVVLLHGYGAPGDNLVGLAKDLSSALPAMSFLVPAGPHRSGGSGRSWLPDISAPTREEYGKRLQVEVESTSLRVWAVINAARRKGVRCGDIYVGGFSQGGRMAAEVALRGPQDCHLAGVMVMSGSGFDGTALPPATGHGPLRVLVTHGSADAVVRFATGWATAQHFAAGGHDVRWLPFAGPHAIAPEVRQALPAFLRGEVVGTAVAVAP